MEKTTTSAGPPRPVDPAVLAARDRENVVVGDEIVRHRLAARVIHWTVAATFFACLLTGMPIWAPVFGWMAALFGGLSVCRVLHPWFGLAFFAASAVMFVDWVSEMHLEGNEREWWGPRLFEYLRWEAEDPEVGKYNGGQKVFFWAVGLGAVGLLLSGAMMWFPERFPKALMQLSYVVHDVTFILFAVGIVFHIYLGTAAEPGTFGSMTRGTVTKRWARLHHPRWFRDVTGEESRRG
jgi:formate dehydrogenase subunit gamma